MTEEPYEYVKRLRTVHAPISPEGIDAHYGHYRRPRIPTMDGKVVIEAAIPGWQPVWWWRERGVERLPPGAEGGATCIQEQADAIIECVKAGAAVVHTQPRDPSDGLSRVHAPELLAEIMDRAFSEVDFITAHHTWGWDFARGWETDYVSYPRELLELGKGNKYVQCGMVMSMPGYDQGAAIHSKRAIAEGTRFFEENRIKPMFSVEAFAFERYKETLFDTGVARWKPYWIAVQLGKHVDQLTWQDPWSYRLTINCMEMVKRNMPGEDVFLGVPPAGRNWLPMTVVALLYGAQVVRVGLEDQFYLWPHRDDIPQKASDTVELLVRIVKDLGREVATVDEAREITGVELTTKD
ncbi:hypothetical protein AC482_05595 [miscellaneous Crenarchaeota group-15 archaeon DG-45]|uniref:3-keto-5-aminohexanoate cleavage protein n=1 Tax=miscellaneous Crenarchaeota group-15 archaeon DG-45 TaxID=1685127 RepID=A0A0M0BN85_9ARCH|nr:MAG: hypothetical protein AC482_05595 [miscellaneous Crenarchaeota group-15 archaeon DG-45]